MLKVFCDKLNYRKDTYNYDKKKLLAPLQVGFEASLISL